MPDPGGLVAAARGLLPPVCAVAAADPATLYPLLPGEALPGAIPARLAEFSAGRHAARAALAGLDLMPVALPQGADRAPIWPAGVAGNITHSRSACLAAASRGLRGLGLDLEEDRPLDPALWDEVLLPEERRWAEAQPDPGRAAMLVFSAKEAAYKAQYPLSRRLFGFDALALAFDGPHLTATFRAAVAPFAAGDTIRGRWAVAEGHILTAATL